MFKKKLLSTIKKSFFIGFSAFLFGTGSSILAPQTSASPGFFEYNWDQSLDIKSLNIYNHPLKGMKDLPITFSLEERIEKKILQN